MHDDDNLRADHDWTPNDEEREAALERALGWVAWILVSLGLWKLADLVTGWTLGPFVGFLGWLLTVLS